MRGGEVAVRPRHMGVSATTDPLEVALMVGQRNRPKRSRRGPARGGSAAARAAQTPPQTGWRATVESYGGFKVWGVIAGVLVVLGIVVVQNPIGFSVSEASLLGDHAPGGPATHVADGTLDSNDPLPRAGGVHYGQPQRVGRYDAPIADGNAIHALEHGIIWISYQPDSLSAEDISALEGVQSDFGRDTILSPRPANAEAIVIASWERRLTFDSVDVQTLRDFITTNRNRSPEPGIR